MIYSECALLWSLVVIQHWSFLLVSRVWKHRRYDLSSSFSLLFNLSQLSIGILMILCLSNLFKESWWEYTLLRGIIRYLNLMLRLMELVWSVHLLRLLYEILDTILLYLFWATTTYSLVVGCIVRGLGLTMTIDLSMEWLDIGITNNGSLLLDGNLIWILIIICGIVWTWRFVGLEGTH